MWGAASPDWKASAVRRVARERRVKPQRAARRCGHGGAAASRAGVVKPVGPEEAKCPRWGGSALRFEIEKAPGLHRLGAGHSTTLHASRCRRRRPLASWTGWSRGGSSVAAAGPAAPASCAAPMPGAAAARPGGSCGPGAGAPPRAGAGA
jgi:hypothetical protein